MQMKAVLLSLFLGLLSFNTFAAMPSDTTIIEFTDKGVKKRVTVLTEGPKSFNVPRILNLDNLLREIGVDSNERKKAIVLVEGDGGERDTILVIARDGRQVKIVAKNPFPDSVSDSTTSDSSRRRYPDNDDRWEHGNSTQGSRPEEEDNDEDDRDQPIELGKKRFFSKSDFGFYLGLNGWSNNFPAAPDQLSELRTGSSRYVALSFRKNITLANTESTDVAISLGPEIAWYNFMFRNENTVVYRNNQVAFIASDQPLIKSKLVMPYINFPVMLNFGFEKPQLQLGFGGYVGYRIGGYMKAKDTNHDKLKVRESYGMNDWFYGVTGEIGKRRGLKLFVRYDLSPMFRSNQVNAKELQAWSAGIRI